MKTALFVNIDSKSFTGYWNGKPRTFKPGESAPLPEYLARHFAKHLTNSILIGKGLEKSTSPKFPEQVPQFMEVFKQCCLITESSERSEDEIAADPNKKTIADVHSDISASDSPVIPPSEDDEDYDVGTK